MSESDDENDGRNLAEQYADRYGGSDHGFSLLSEDSDEEPGVPGGPSPPDPAEADPELARTFWILVLVFNVAIAGLAIGPMMILFRGWWELGLQATLVGVVAFAYGTVRYYRFRNSRDEDAEHNG